MRPRRRRILIGFVSVIGLLAAVLAWQAPRTAQLAVETSAKWACQCRYIDGGDDAFCEGEDPLGFGGTSFRFEHERNEVTASIPALAAATGRYEPDVGCVVR